MIVVGGEGNPRDAIDSGDEELSGSWKDGGVASGSVVKRIPVDTVGISSTNTGNITANTHLLHFSPLR